MEFLDANFRRIRDNFIIPRINYGIRYNKANFWSFKENLVNKIISIKKKEGKTYEILMPVDDYFKSIHCDIELFTNKYEIQLYELQSQKYISQTWNFVTLYYFNFFLTTCLFRFLNRGFIFLNTTHAKIIQDTAYALNSEIIAVNHGNYYFYSPGVDAYGNIVVNLSFKGDNVHKSTWIQLEAILVDFYKYSKNEEKALLGLFLSHFKCFAHEYPSILRNKLNYNGESSLLDLNRSLIDVNVILDIDSKFLKKLSKVALDKESDISKMRSFELLASYLYSLLNSLHYEYQLRSDFGKDFKKNREQYKFQSLQANAS